MRTNLSLSPLGLVPLVAAIAVLSFSAFTSRDGGVLAQGSCGPTDGFDFPVGKPDHSGWGLEQPFGVNTAYPAHKDWTHAGDDWQKLATAGPGDSALSGTQTAGQAVYAVASGRVRYVGGEYPGRVVIVEHSIPGAAAIFSMYGHLENVRVTADACIKRGDQLGTIIKWKRVSNSHLHFEIRDFLTRDDVNGAHPSPSFRCGLNCPPGPGYWTGDPSAMGWKNPSCFIEGHRPSSTVITGLTISGTVYVDTNGNGAKDCGETGSAGATVTLSSASFPKEATTDASGNYSFPNLEAGNYTVTLSVPSGYQVTTMNPLTLVVASGGTALVANFGIATAARNTPTISTQPPSPTPRPVATSPPAARGKIAFTRYHDAQRDIFVMNADGSGETKLTSNGTSRAPAWSPDGSRIAFTSDPYKGASDIYVMNADGSGQTNLTNSPASNDEPAWSPDGTRIAFNCDGDICVMNADGSGQTRLTNNGRVNGLAWSPDGTRIAFTRFVVSDIYVMNADGSGQTNLTNDPGAYDGPAWSPAP